MHWRGGEVVSGDLEKKLLSLGCANAITYKNNMAKTSTPNTFKGVGAVGTGQPSATFVDEIDFTGGAGGRALGTSRDGSRGAKVKDNVWGTAALFPGAQLGDKPGDNMDPKGNEPPPSSRGGKGLQGREKWNKDFKKDEDR